MQPFPYRQTFVKDGVEFRDLIAFMDKSNTMHLMRANSEDDRGVLYSHNVINTSLSGRTMVELPCLPDKHKFRKKAFYEDPKKVFAYDIRLRIAVIIDSQGMGCVVNTHYKTKKFVFLEDKLKIKKVFIMPMMNEMSPFQEQLMNKRPNSEELEKEDNIYRFLEDSPDFDFLISIITNDGWIITVGNEARFCDLRVTHRINIQTAILQAKYLPDKGKLIVVAKEGVFRIYDVFKDMKVIKQFNMLWPDVTSLDMKSDEMIVVGHESGIIYT